MKRPIRDRVWFWKPQWYWRGWKTLIPFSRGGDEYDWHTVVLGWTVTGRVIIATNRCPQTGRCASDEYPLAPDWPGCQHEWTERNQGPGFRWQECWLCGEMGDYEDAPAI